MITPEDHNPNQAAYRRLKDDIDRTYAPGRFVALAHGRIVADAPTFEELDSGLSAQGLESPDVLVVQAGAEYPEESIILFHGLPQRAPLLQGNEIPTKGCHSVLGFVFAFPCRAAHRGRQNSLPTRDARTRSWWLSRSWSA